jgi:hypothetical protein
MARSSVAVLGTLAEFHRESIPYDLAAVVRLVSDLQPDLLCLDITPDQWQRHDFSDLPPEYRDALLPLAYQTDIVVVPIAGKCPPAEPSATGWRRKAIALLRRWLATLQRTATGPTVVNEGPRHFLANLLYGGIATLAERETRHAEYAHTNHLVQQVLEVLRRDPGRRVLVAVNVRHCHQIRHALENCPQVRIARYFQL